MDDPTDPTAGMSLHVALHASRRRLYDAMIAALAEGRADLANDPQLDAWRALAAGPDSYIDDGYVSELQAALESAIAEVIALQAHVIYGSWMGWIESVDPEEAAKLLDEALNPDDYKRVWSGFWERIITDVDEADGTPCFEPAVETAIEYLDAGDADEARLALRGALNFDQIQRELHDYANLMHSASGVYSEVTSNKLSKTNYPADTVIAVWQEGVEAQAEALADAARPFTELEPPEDVDDDEPMTVTVTAGDLRRLVAAVDGDLPRTD